MSWKPGKSRRMLAILGAAVALVPAAAAGAVAVAAPQKGSNDTTPVALRGFLLVGRAEGQVARADRDCSLRVSHPKPRIRFGAGAPSSALAGTLGVLRRPQTAAEQAAPLPDVASEGAGDITFFRSATRIVHDPDGMSETIQVGSGRVSVPEIFEPACRRRVAVALAKLAKSQPAAVRRAATNLLRSEVRSRAITGTHDWMALGGSISGGAFVWDAKAFRDNGLLTTLQGDPVSQAVGVVPDGVASVTLHLAGHARPSLASLLIEPGGYKPKPGRGGTIRAAVTDNVYFMPHLPEPIASAAVRRMTWRDASGRVIHVTSLG